MAEQFVSERNLRFLLHEVFDVQSLLQYPRYSEHSTEVFDMILQTAMKMGKDLFKPTFSDMDKNQPEYVNGQVKVHPSVRNLMRECGAGGWISATSPAEVGGQQLPIMVGFLPSCIFQAANYSASAFPALTSVATHLIETFCSQEIIDAYLPKMFAGEWQGTMALTEPQAGSSLSDLITAAEPTAEGHYLIHGQKIFISAGDHDGVDNIVHMLLGRIKGSPPGVKGISLFVVPKKRIDKNGELIPNDVNCAGIYHKLGYRGAPITQLSFGENNDCHGYLVGEPNKGLFYMFHMMNEARIEVGLGAAAIASAAYYASLEYSKERPQGRSLVSKDPTSPQIPIIEHPDVRRMLLFQKAVVEGAISLLMQCSRYADLEKVLTDEERENYNLLLEILTPVAKSYPAEMGILSVSQGLQCLGGYGYCDEFPLEQHYRDVRIHPIHEGTTGIQGMDLLGRKVTMKKGKALKLYLLEVQKTIKESKTFPELVPYAEKLENALQLLESVTGHLLDVAAKGKPDRFLADATVYLDLFATIAIAWQWLLQAKVAKNALMEASIGSDINFYQGKIYACRYFFGYELPKIESLAKILKENDGLTVEMKTDCFFDC